MRPMSCLSSPMTQALLCPAPLAVLSPPHRWTVSPTTAYATTALSPPHCAHPRAPHSSLDAITTRSDTVL
jgi:hypothetical protein